MKLDKISRVLNIGLLMLALLFSLAPVLKAQTVPMGRYGWIPVVTTNVAADTATLTNPQMLGILNGTPTAAAAYTTPTATLMCGMFPWLKSAGLNQWGYDWFIKNSSAGAFAITATAGTGVTVVGTATVAQSAIKHFKIVFTSCGAVPAVRIYSLGSSVF